MANASSAYGDICFEASSMTDLERLVRLFDTVLGPDVATYFTAIQNDFCKDDVEIEKKEDGKEYFYFTASFTGNGRWVYECNIENMGPWLENSAKNVSLQAQDEVLRLRSVPWKVMFDYNDFESGCRVLESVKADCVHNAGEAFSKISSHCIERKVHDYTADNLVEIAFEEDAWDLSPNYVEYALQWTGANEVLKWLSLQESGARETYKKDLSKHLIESCKEVAEMCPIIGDIWDCDAEPVRKHAKKWLDGVLAKED